jgi:hypothetical protein
MVRSLVPAAGVAALIVAAATMTPSAQASQLEIQFLGLDLRYTGMELHDATSVLGGGGAPAEADPLTAVTFLVDGTPVGMLSSDIWADILISGLTNIPVGGGPATSAGNGDGFGFDILTNAGGFGLALNIDQAQVFYSGFQVFISGGGAATSIPFQNLPFGLVVDTSMPVTFAFSSANMSAVTDNGVSLTGFNASGTGNIQATLVPEPGVGILLGLGMIAAVGSRRRRWS